MGQLRLFSANLANGAADPEALALAIGILDPDIVAAQELGPDCARVLSVFYDHGVLEPGIDFAGRGLVGHRPFEVEELPIPRRSGLVGHLAGPRWNSGPHGLAIASVHLTNPTTRPLGKSRITRQRQVEWLGSYFSNSRTHVILGDMNATPMWPLYRRLRVLGTDAARSAGRPQRTWSLAPWHPAMLRIDHAFVTGVSVLDVQTYKIRGSDHRALVVDITVPS